MPNQKAPECECSVIAHMAAEPNLPITYDVKMHEWHIVGADGAKTIIYHCFFCGGRMPRSRREDFFHTVSDAESRRLFDLTRPLKTVADVVAAFGQPESDNPQGTTITLPEHKGGPRTDAYRNLTYSNLSPSTLLEVIVGTDGAVRFSLIPKPLGDHAP
jgi:hypothetical protein